MSDTYTFEAMRRHGVLWYLNRVAFHPRGYALAFTYPPDADREAVVRGDVEPTGWTLLGDGAEPWTFGELPDGEPIDDTLFARFEALLARSAARRDDVAAQRDLIVHLNRTGVLGDDDAAEAWNNLPLR